MYFRKFTTRGINTKQPRKEGQKVWVKLVVLALVSPNNPMQNFGFLENSNLIL